MKLKFFLVSCVAVLAVPHSACASYPEGEVLMECSPPDRIHMSEPGEREDAANILIGFGQIGSPVEPMQFVVPARGKSFKRSKDDMNPTDLRKQASEWRTRKQAKEWRTKQPAVDAFQQTAVHASLDSDYASQFVAAFYEGNMVLDRDIFKELGLGAHINGILANCYTDDMYMYFVLALCRYQIISPLEFRDHHNKALINMNVRSNKGTEAASYNMWYMYVHNIFRGDDAQYAPPFLEKAGEAARSQFPGQVFGTGQNAPVRAVTTHQPDKGNDDSALHFAMDEGE
jgi:hypothetical protein